MTTFSFLSKEKNIKAHNDLCTKIRYTQTLSSTYNMERRKIAYYLDNIRNIELITGPPYLIGNKCQLCWKKNNISNTTLCSNLVKTNCNHIVCKKCIKKSLEQSDVCPVCNCYFITQLRNYCAVK
jgi:hypothetical protein